jgi:hypothetical protein
MSGAPEAAPLWGSTLRIAALIAVLVLTLLAVSFWPSAVEPASLDRSNRTKGNQPSRRRDRG